MSFSSQPCDPPHLPQLRLRQRDVEALLTHGSARYQELQRNRGLAGPRIALEQEQASRGESAAEDIVETSDAGGGVAWR